MASAILSLPLFASDYSGDLLRNVAIAFIVLETVAVVLRFASLRLSKKPFGLDDWLTIPGYLCCLGLIILSLVGIKVGKIGYHLGYITIIQNDYDALTPWGKCMYATPILYAAACCFTRMTLLTLYLRIFEKHRPYRIACYTLMALLISLALAMILVSIFICLPVSSFWKLPTAGDVVRCIDVTAFYRYGTLPNPILDVMMLVLPQPIVWKLQLPRQAKIGLAVTFLTGSVGTITSICRCVAYFTNNPLSDGTWLSVTFLKWSIIETGVYLIAACLPCYRPLIRFTLERGRSLSSRYHAKNSTVASSGFEEGISYDKPPQIPAAVIDSRTDLEMSESIYDPVHRQRVLRDSDEESLVDLEYRS